MLKGGQTRAQWLSVLGIGVFFISLFLFPARAGAFWPFTWQLGEEKRYLGPLVSYDADDGEKHLVIRPFLFSYDSEEGGVYRYLYPLGRTSPESSFFLPIYRAKKAGPDRDVSFLLFFGGTSAKGNYGGFFPFYGTLYNRFAKDEIRFVAWPFYSYVNDGGAEKRDIVYPFFSLYTGADQGFKTWPFYGDRYRLGERRKRFYAWPFVFREERNLDTDDPAESLMVLPFWVHSRSRSGAMEYKGVLWPFFTYSKNSSREKWNFPWPFFSKTTGETKGYDYFPFIAREESGTDTQFSLFWPVYREYRFFVKGEEYFQKSVLVINRYMVDDRGTFFNIWPFFEYEQKDDDSTLLAPSVLPFRDRGITRIMKPLMTLYERNKRKDRTSTSLLYGFYTYEETDESFEARLAFLFDMKKDEDGRGFEVLSGLFGVDPKTVKVFFIPFSRTSAKSP